MKISKWNQTERGEVMTAIEISEKILDGTFDQEIQHAEESNSPPSDYKILTHYGVKGMKWGVRKEYVPHPRKSKRINFNSKRDLQKKIAIGTAVVAGVLIGVGAMYVYKKSTLPTHISSYRFGSELDIASLKDDGFTLKSGTKFSRISTEKIEDYAETGRLYVSYLRKDNRLYKETMPDFFNRWEQQGIIKDASKVYQHTITIKKDVKVPSEKVMAEIYSKTISNGPIDMGKYRQFMADLNDMSNPIVANYLSAIKKAGYDAIQDLNDKGYAKSPLILIDPETLVDSVSSKRGGKLGRFINVLLL